MTGMDKLIERLRTIDPAVGFDLDVDGPSGRRIRATLSRDIGAPSDGKASRSRSVPRKRVALAAALALTTIGGAAVASVAFRPDPHDVRVVLEQAGVNNPGMDNLPVLTTSVILCAYADGLVTTSHHHDLAVDEPMTTDHLVSACAEGGDAVRAGEVQMPRVTGATFCEAVVPAAEVRRRLDRTPERIVEGDLTDRRPWVPLVLNWDGDCAATTLDVSPQLQLSPLTSTDAVNDARMVEIELLASAAGRCLAREDVMQLARTARSQLDGDWLITETLDDAARQTIACYSGVRVDPGWGILDVDGWGG